MLKLIRMTVCQDGFLLFAAFSDESVDTFEDRVRTEPLHAYHKKSYLEGLIEAEGWKIVSSAEPRPFIPSSSLGRPAPTAFPR
jgi:hypothetical protein